MCFFTLQVPRFKKYLMTAPYTHVRRSRGTRRRGKEMSSPRSHAHIFCRLTPTGGRLYRHLCREIPRQLTRRVGISSAVPAVSLFCRAYLPFAYCLPKNKKCANRSRRTEKRRLRLSPNKILTTPLARMHPLQISVILKFCLSSLLYHTFFAL